MAKTSKGRKSKVPASKTRTEKVRPRYMKPGTSYKMKLHDVIKAMKVIEEHEHLEKFVRASKRKDTTVHVDADTVNFVKNFMVKNKMHAHPIGRHIVNAIVAPGEDPFKPCKFGKRG